MSTNGRRLRIVVSLTVAVCVLIGLYVVLYLTNVPGSASASPGAGGTAQLHLATVAASETSDPRPSWVSYYAVDANDQNWRHVTTYTLPANSLVHVTIYQFDGQSGLRNPFISQAQGIVGGSFLLNGKPTVAIDPDAASHIFAIPELGVSVPLYGIPDSAKNPCDNAPCPLSTDHETISFTFRTGAKGLYRWQCFVPCAAGTIDGFGGAMQTVGYMDGYIKVV
jgi:hypothetical protein